MKTCKIRLKSTGAVLTVRSYGNGWVDCCGNFYHRTVAKVINPAGDL